MVIGVTGKYCAGKTTVAALVESHGFLHIEVDHLGHAAIKHKKEQIVRRFGPSVLAKNGGDDIDRRALGSVVFNDDEALHDLEAIVHPEMVEMVERTIAADSDRDIVINAAILFRMKLDRLCDHVLWVDSPALLRLRRAMRRDGLRLSDAISRFRSQSDVSFAAAQHSYQNVDIMKVVNSCGRRRLARNVDRILRMYRGSSM